MLSNSTLTTDQYDRYQTDGYVQLHDVFTANEIDRLCAALIEDQRILGPHLITEDDGVTLRALYGSHLRHPVFQRLVRDERLLGPAQQIAGDDLYVHQLKVNSKQSFGGERWAWHQDFVVWRDADGMPAPRQVNVAVLLDDVTEFNGPVVFLRGSHRLGTIERGASADSGHIDPDRYGLTERELATLVEQHELVSSRGKRGGVVLFSPEIVHGSNTNISPFSRRLLIVTYNPVTVAPHPTGEPRPEYLAGRDLAPLVAAQGSLDSA